MDTQSVLLFALAIAIIIPPWLLFIFQWTGILVPRAVLNAQIEQTKIWYDQATHAQKVTVATAETLDEISGEFQTVMKDALDVHFNINELKDMCYELQIPWENLEGTTKNGKIISIVDYLVSHNEIGKLNNYLRVNRKDVWLGRRGSNARQG